MLTARAFWMMKISTTMRTAMPVISAVRMPLIRVCSPRRRGAAGAGRGGAEPLAEAGGSVMVEACGAAGVGHGASSVANGNRGTSDRAAVADPGYLAGLAWCLPMSQGRLYIRS